MLSVYLRNYNPTVLCVSFRYYGPTVDFYSTTVFPVYMIEYRPAVIYVVEKLAHSAPWFRESVALQILSRVSILKK